MRAIAATHAYGTVLVIAAEADAQRRLLADLTRARPAAIDVSTD